MNTIDEVIKTYRELLEAVRNRSNELEGLHNEFVAVLLHHGRTMKDTVLLDILLNHLHKEKVAFRKHTEIIELLQMSLPND